MDDNLKLQLLASLRTGHFTFFSDETQVYANFDHAGKISEHFIGILPLSKMVGTTLSPPNIMKFLEQFFQNIEATITNCCFSCMDPTNVNSGEKVGLKSLLKHAVLLAIWIGCGNHKHALCFKHLLGKFPFVSYADSTFNFFIIAL